MGKILPGRFRVGVQVSNTPVAHSEHLPPSHLSPRSELEAGFEPRSRYRPHQAARRQTWLCFDISWRKPQMTATNIQIMRTPAGPRNRAGDICDRRGSDSDRGISRSCNCIRTELNPIGRQSDFARPSRWVNAPVPAVFDIE